MHVLKPTSTRGRLHSMLLVAAALMLSATACSTPGSSPSANGGGAGAPMDAAALKTMTSKVAALREPSNTFVAPGPKLDATSLQGQSIWYVSLSQAIPVLAIEQNGLMQAATALGMSMHVCDGKFQPALAAGCMNAAVSAGAKGIVTDSVTLASVSTAVANAASHHVPIVAMSAIGTNTKDVAFFSDGDEMSQAIAADWIIADSKGGAQVLGTSVQDDSGARNDITAGSAPEFSQCTGCTTVTANYTSGTVPSVPSVVSSSLLSHPQLTYGFPQFDFLVPLFKSGVQTGGFANKMKIVSTNAVLSSMQLVKSGGQAADVGANRNYAGWGAMDSMLRLINGMPVVAKSTVPQRVFDSQNINSITLTEAAAGTGEWWGPLDYQKSFQTLWGLS
jgi:ribose transport system substrate-binding protein